MSQTTDYRIKTQRDLRAAFWEANPNANRKKFRDGSYPTDTRVAFVDFVDWLERDGTISESLAQRVTLGAR